jgi:putative transposase
MIFHHDRGGHYLSTEFRAQCRKLGIVQSAGRVGSCHDNRPAESFWASLTQELVSRVRFATRAKDQHPITTWITHDKTTRLHSSLGTLPSIEWELSYRLVTRQAAQPPIWSAGGRPGA